MVAYNIFSYHKIVSILLFDNTVWVHNCRKLIYLWWSSRVQIWSSMWKFIVLCKANNLLAFIASSLNGQCTKMCYHLFTLELEKTLEKPFFQYKKVCWLLMYSDAKKTIHATSGLRWRSLICDKNANYLNYSFYKWKA